MRTEFLNTLLLSPIPEVADAARQARMIVLKFDNKEISAKEFVELIEDVARLDLINREMITLERYAEIADAFNKITTLKNIM